MTKRVDVAVFETINATLQGEFEGGIHSGGLKEKWVGCTRLPEEQGFWEEKFNFTEVPLATAITDKINDARNRIVAGEITVPSAF